MYVLSSCSQKETKSKRDVYASGRVQLQQEVQSDTLGGRGPGPSHSVACEYIKSSRISAIRWMQWSQSDGERVLYGDGMVDVFAVPYS